MHIARPRMATESPSQQKHCGCGARFFWGCIDFATFVSKVVCECIDFATLFLKVVCECTGFATFFSKVVCECTGFATFDSKFFPWLLGSRVDIVGYSPLCGHGGLLG